MHYYVGWDVGGWNCDRNRNSRDALIALSNRSGPLEICGKPFRGNLRKQFNEHKTPEGIVNDACGTSIESSDRITIAIDTPLGFPVAIKGLINGELVSAHLPHSYSDNPYLYRQTERWLFEQGFSPLSAIKDMIGSQATKGMHLLRSLGLQTSSDRCGVWTDGRVTAIETYPAACQGNGGSECFVDLVKSLNVTGHKDVCDAVCCAAIAYQFVHHRELLVAPLGSPPCSEGWIWVPAEVVSCNM